MIKKIVSLGLVGTALVFAGCGSSNSAKTTESAPATTAAATSTTAVTAADALDNLKKGNDSYQANKLSIAVSDEKRKDLSDNGQHPYATVITCSDSRVPAELVFDCGLGEIFTIRTAGNVVDSFETGSVEYAVDHLKTPLVVVMGHTNCGAVAGAIEGHAEGHVEDIINEIKPSVSKAQSESNDAVQVARLSETYNVQNSINELMDSEIISSAVNSGKLKVVGAVYDISTGKVTFLDA